MKFLLDQGLPRSTVDYLRDSGVESEHVGALGVATASDEILSVGRDRGAVVGLHSIPTSTRSWLSRML
ncbi:DUF5615 family PIN-like protein [Rosistilla oblonga]|uniref:DUF5615 domain-containing protein n=1 Tax=Rosistilla oblonga TaxID=2527990 RepID=A0A518IZ10_9BACT|nr:hypothetical protein Mal33_43430 [Rosistilla oblonga]